MMDHLANRDRLVLKETEADRALLDFLAPLDRVAIPAKRVTKEFLAFKATQVTKANREQTVQWVRLGPKVPKVIQAQWVRLEVRYVSNQLFITPI